MQFYSKLTGMQVPPELMNGTIGFFPMGGLDLLAFADAKRLQWEVLYPLDKGGTQTDFFVIEDSDSHQIIIGSHALYPNTAFPQIAEHPIHLLMEQICLSVKDEIAATILRYPGELEDATLRMIIQDPDGLPIIIRQQLASEYLS